MSKVVWDVIIVLVIVSFGGFFAAAEMALVSLREGQVRMLARRGKRGVKAAKLAADPNRFLSAVQIGMTLATLVSGAFGADTLSGVLRSSLVHQGMDGAVATPLAFAIVTVCITFVSLVLGELAPKRIALQRAVSLSLLAAPLLDRIALLARPVVWLLSVSVNMIVALLGGDPRKGRQAMTEQELRELVTGTQALSDDERHIVGEVFDAGKRQLREVLLPRTEVEFLAADTTIAEAAVIAANVPYSRLPVFQGSYDNVIGFVHIRDLLGPGAVRVGRVEQVVRPVKFLPISKTVLAALSEMRRERAHLAIVADEYGGTAGIITLEDLVEELIGDIRDEYDIGESPATRLPRGEVDVDGLLNLDEFAEQTGIELPEGPYETVAGYVLAALGEVPSPGDSTGVPGFVITVTEMDGRRIARLRVTPARQAPEAGQPPAGQPPLGGVAAPQPATDSQASADSPLPGPGDCPYPGCSSIPGHPGPGREYQAAGYTEELPG
ncbi:MAG TPA: hemolysin family protein [Trebonia sp.]